MHAFGKLSIRQKLTMMGILASGTAILLACTAFLTYELFAYRGDMIRSLFTQAEIVGANSAAAILFNDEPAAAETLAALKADPHIVSAGIYTRDNRAFATYGRIDKQRAVALRERFADHADGHWFESDGLILFRKIVFKGETIGTVYIQSDLEEMHARFWQYLAIIFVVLLASSSVAFVISSRLQRNITRPLFHLVETAQTVSREKDYTIRAVAESQDEMGVLVRAFNEMLVQIQDRDVALRKSSDVMEQRVLERTAQLHHTNMELAQSEERFRSVAQSANDAIISADRAERILTWNKGARMIYGYTEEEAVGKPLTILMPERDREAYRKGLEQVRASGETGGIGSTIELHGLRKDANEFPLEISLAAWEAGGETFYSSIVRDVTERKRAEEAFRKSEAKYRTLFDSVDEGVCIIEVLFDGNDKPIDFRFLEVNPSFEKQTGIQSARGRSMREIAPLHEEHWFEIYGKIALTGEPARFENQAAQLGRWYDVYALRVGEPQERRVAIFFKDITERRRAEETLRRAHDQLEARVQERTAEILKKTRDLETLLYVTSHDLREPLRSIENFSRMVHDRYAKLLDDKGRDFLQRVVRGAQRMDQLMTDILALSRAQRMELPTEEIDSESIVREALRRLDDKIKEIGATVRVVENLPRWQGNRTWATQGVYNLIANALKFTRNGEAPEVEIAPYRPTVGNGDEAGIVVRDRGPGVAPEHAERIFQLFQRAVGREVEGTGAGLAIVRQVAERHGGRAWVQPREGGGSEFILTFGTDASTKRK
jgi:PAS domain S-box-containing protein